MKLSKNAKNAFMLGALCSVAYFAVYIARNILGAVTPQMLTIGYTEEYIGSISSLFFVFYAFGQLINGAIGDRIKARWMISVGLLGAGITNLVFSLIADMTPTLAMIAYATTGFFLSMIYGPMTKVVSENTEHIHAVRCSVGYTFASFFGSPAAGVLASFLVWQSVFTVSSAIMISMAIACFSIFLLFEKRGIVKYGQIQTEKKGAQNVKVLFKHHIVKFSLVSILTGVVRTSVVFWLTTYLAQYLHFSDTDAASIYTLATLFISLAALVAIFIYERIGRNVHLALLLMFGSAVIFFVLTYFVTSPILNIIMIILAIMSSNCAASMLWSVYCPSLKSTGIVSGATGFLDFLSYMAAAAANLIFANAATTIGWGNLILVWAGLMLVGVIVSLPFRKNWGQTEGSDEV